MEKINPHSGHRKRLRAQVVQSGLDSMHEHQVLEYMLSFLLPQKDTNVVAHALIEKFGSYSKVFEADINSLKEVKGVGEVVAHFLYSFRDFYYYYQKKREVKGMIVNNTESSIQCILPILTGKHVEEFYIVCIDPRNKVTTIDCMARGNEIQASIDVRKISKYLTDNNVYNFFIAHNHPDGDAIPSAEDDKLTKALMFSSRINGIKMCDHIIVGKDSVYSYYQDHKIESYREEADKMLGVQAIKVSQNYASYEGEKWRILLRMIMHLYVQIVVGVLIP